MLTVVFISKGFLEMLRLILLIYKPRIVQQARLEFTNLNFLKLELLHEQQKPKK